MTMTMIKHCLLIVLLTLGLNLSAADIMRLVTTTSTENSGLADYLLTEFTRDTGIKVHMVAVGTGKALAIARNGDADAILVHSKFDEIDFVEQGFGIKRHDVMYNDFIIVGPQPLDNSTSVTDALNEIANNQALFVSRGDESGTHKKELSLWQQAGIEPESRWYRESGQGMGKSLQMASELGAYVLTDRGTWLAQNANQDLHLEVVFEGDESLFNPYSAIVISPERHPHVNETAANSLIEWLTSKKGQQMIADYQVQGEQLFFPNAN